MRSSGGGGGEWPIGCGGRVGRWVGWVGEGQLCWKTTWATISAEKLHEHPLGLMPTPTIMACSAKAVVQLAQCAWISGGSCMRTGAKEGGGEGRGGEGSHQVGVG